MVALHGHLLATPVFTWQKTTAIHTPSFLSALLAAVPQHEHERD